MLPTMSKKKYKVQPVSWMALDVKIEKQRADRKAFHDGTLGRQFREFTKAQADAALVKLQALVPDVPLQIVEYNDVRL